MEPKPYAYHYEWARCITTDGPQGYRWEFNLEPPEEWAIESGQARSVTPLFKLATTPSEGVAFIPLCARCAETGECRPLGARGCEGVAAPVEQVTSEPVAWKLTTIAPEGRKPLVFLIDNKDEATYAHSLWEGSVLTPLCPLSPAQPSAEQVRNAALKEVADLMDGMEDGVWANTCGPRIRKLCTSGEKGESND